LKIVAEALTKKFNSFTALDSVSFKIEGKACFGYLGPNGAGKTTTMKIFTTLLRPTSGRAYVNDIDVTKDPVNALRYIGSLIEDPEPYSFMTVEEFITYASKIRGKGVPDVKSLKEKLDLPDLKRRCSKLSKGQKRRVFLAAIIAQDPEIMILDEPSAGLDPAESVIFRNLILQMKREKMIFLSSHLLHEVNQVCDYVYFINKGRIVGQGDIQEISKRFVSNAIRIEFSSKVDESKIKSLLDEGIVTSYTKENESIYNIVFDGKEETRKRILEKIVPLGIRSVTDSSLGLEKAYLELISGKEGPEER
jgi:ABC-2 type transport system ATP-binding protein